MLRKYNRQKEQVEDTRKVAIYARKSVITHKGDSTGIQIKQCSDYASSQLSLPRDYGFSIYTDKGLSGYYSDRPDFQRMLHDIEADRIKAVVCYKLDRISRKTSDLMSLLDFFERHNVVLLVCSNNINTGISTSKIMISFLAIIAEFERDILTERVTDNLYELAKDGRWMGGLPPTGFERYRISVGAGKNKTAVTHLKPIPDERKMVTEIFSTFLRLRSVNGTMAEINKKYRTVKGNAFRVRGIRDILINPVYCIADKDAYDFFYENEASICADKEAFDGTHAVSSYNRRVHSKIEDDESTFFRPKFSTKVGFRDIADWLITIADHEGFISGKDWVETQNILQDIADKYNRPHNASLALLGGKVYCSECGSRMRVLAQSGRLNPDGTQRFRYGCPGHFKDQICSQMNVHGQELDHFVIDQISELAQDKSGRYYPALMDKKIYGTLQNNSAEEELSETKKEIQRMESDIAAQVRNLRAADESIRQYIQADIEEISNELAAKRKLVEEFEKKVASSEDLSEGLSDIRRMLINFKDLVAGSSYEERLKLVNTIVDRVIIRVEGGMQVVHVFIKGNQDENYDDFYNSEDNSINDCERLSDKSIGSSECSDIEVSPDDGSGLCGKMYNREQCRQYRRFV